MSKEPNKESSLSSSTSATNTTDRETNAGEGKSNYNSAQTVKYENSAVQCCLSAESTENKSVHTMASYLPSEMSSNQIINHSPQPETPPLIDDDAELFCRICHEVEDLNAFISPCNCKGTIALVHKTCIERWLAERDTNLCEICNFQYKTQRTAKYSITKSLYLWLTSDDTKRERRDAVIDLVGIGLFAPFASTGTYIGFVLADAIEDLPINDVENVSFRQLVTLISGRIAVLTVISLLITVDVAYATWIAIKLRNHFNNWYTWYRRNSKVTIVPTPTTESD